MADFRSITDVEEVTSLTGEEKIIINDNGTAKQVSAQNAKFGGGGVTVFVMKQVGSDK